MLNFDRKNYSAMVRSILRQGFHPSSYKVLVSSEASDLRGRVLFRHDVDFCLDSALQIAEWDAGLGIESTFFVLVNTDFYNLSSNRCRVLLGNLVNLGHSVGLHFDAHGLDESDLLPRLLFEKGVLDDSLPVGVSVDSFSFHRPAALGPEKNLNNLGIRSGLIDAYDSRIFNPSIYCSDSGGEWAYGDPSSRDWSSERDTIQVLTHPEWWVYNQPSPTAILNQFISNISELNRGWVKSNCKVF